VRLGATLASFTGGPKSVNPGAILGGFRLVAWLFPPPRLRSFMPLSAEELAEQYRSRDRWCNVLGVLILVGLGAGFYFVAEACAKWWQRRWADAPYFYRPTALELGIWAGFLALFCTLYVMFLILRLALGADEYRLYIAYASNKLKPYPYDVLKIARWFFWLFAPLLLALIVFRVDTYMAFTDKAVVENPFLSLGVEHVWPYAAVRGVYEVQGYHARFEDKIAPFHVIVFNDGRRWESEHGSGGPKLEQQREGVRFVTRQSRRPFKKVAFIEDITP
jgi:hypothetical protein